MIHYLVYLLFGLAPSIIWLLFFLRKDSHPESNSMVLKVFFYGMLAALPAVFIEVGFAEQIGQLPLPRIILSILYVFIGIALVEEGLKYIVAKKTAIRDPECDEPVDVVLYMIIVALGFAALENLFILFPLIEPFQFWETFFTSAFRFAGATFLHALCAGLIGYFLALSFFESKKRLRLKATGITLAVLLHGLYDFSIIEIDGNLKFLIPAVILIGLAVFITLGFKKVKKLKSICQLKTK